nr:MULTISPECIES: XRE family transcriptional regulator [Mesorhizobium]
MIDPETIDSLLGTRIRVEREQRGWSLSELSQRSGVSRAQINKVERGESSPTASLLGRLSGAFGLTVSALLARAEAARPGRLVRAGEHPRWQDPATGYVRNQIAPGPGSDFPLDLVRVDMPVGASVSYPASAFAFIRQVVIVLDGELTFTEGDVAHDLYAGDSIELGAPTDCTFRNKGGKACSYLVAVVRP